MFRKGKNGDFIRKGRKRSDWKVIPYRKLDFVMHIRLENKFWWKKAGKLIWSLFLFLLLFFVVEERSNRRLQDWFMTILQFQLKKMKP